jgi:hypothetical protein
VGSDQNAGEKGGVTGRGRSARGRYAQIAARHRDRELRHALLGFYHGIAQADIGLHLASIAARDSAVCLILAALLEADRVLAQEPRVNAIFRHIHRDEARHARLSRRIAVELAEGKGIDAVAEHTRLGLVGVLARRGAAFESLGIGAGAGDAPRGPLSNAS